MAEEIITDFAEFVNYGLHDYRVIEIPIRCGHKSGRIYTFSRKENLTNGLLKNYEEGLTEIIERKKWNDSSLYKCNEDIGPTMAVANLMEDCENGENEYTDFINKFRKEGMTLTGLEHVLRVDENGFSHHIMQRNDELDFNNEEQLGLMMYSIYLDLQSGNNVDLSKEKLLWFTKENKKNPKIFGELMKLSRKNDLRHMYHEKYCRDYETISIYKDLIISATKGFNLIFPENIEKEKIASFYQMTAVPVH